MRTNLRFSLIIAVKKLTNSFKFGGMFQVLKRSRPCAQLPLYTLTSFAFCLPLNQALQCALMGQISKLVWQAVRFYLGLKGCKQLPPSETEWKKEWVPCECPWQNCIPSPKEPHQQAMGASKGIGQFRALGWRKMDWGLTLGHIGRILNTMALIKVWPLVYSKLFTDFLNFLLVSFD